MSRTSNIHGAIELREGRAWAWRGGELIGDLPLPLTPDDAKLFAAMCWTKYPGNDYRPFGLTGAMAISVMIAPDWQLRLCKQCAGAGWTCWESEDGGSPILVCGCDGFGYEFEPVPRS